jgi:hypothetical protein
MTGVQMMLKSLGLDLSPEGIKKLMAEIGIDAKLSEAQEIVKSFIAHLDERFTRIEKIAEENQFTLFQKLDAIHDHLLDVGAAGPHSIEGAILIDPLAGFEVATNQVLATKEQMEVSGGGCY